MDNRHISLVFLVAVATAVAMLLAACGRGDQEEWRFFDSPDGGSEEIPEPRDGEFFDEPGDGSSSSSSGSSVPLARFWVMDFNQGVVKASAGQLEAAISALDRAIDSGQQVITCSYGPLDPEAQTGYNAYSFWLEDVPDNIDELLLVARDSGGPISVSSMGTNAISSCPDSRAEGRAAHREDYPGLETSGVVGVVTLEFGDIKTRIWDQQCGEGANIWVSLPDCITQWELDIVFEATSDVGATITQGQMCYIWTDGKLFGLRAFGTACGDPFELEYRIDPDRAFSRHVSGPDLGGETAVVLKYWGTDDEGNAIYLERALSVHTTKFGLDIVERSQYWLADRPYKEWR